MIFLFILNIYIANHVISQIVTNIQALDLAILAKLLKQIFIEIIKMILKLVRVKRLRLMLRLIRLRDDVEIHVRPLVHVGEDEGGGDGRLGVKARTTVAVSAGSDLEVEWAVHSVFLCSEDRCQVLRHRTLSLSLLFLSLLVKIRVWLYER